MPPVLTQEKHSAVAVDPSEGPHEVLDLFRPETLPSPIAAIEQVVDDNLLDVAKPPVQFQIAPVHGDSARPPPTLQQFAVALVTCHAYRQHSRYVSEPRHT